MSSYTWENIKFEPVNQWYYKSFKRPEPQGNTAINILHAKWMNVFKAQIFKKKKTKQELILFWFPIIFFEVHMVYRINLLFKTDSEKLNWSTFSIWKTSNLYILYLARVASTARARIFPSPLAAHAVRASRHRSAKAWSLVDLTLQKQVRKGTVCVIIK